MTDFQRALAEFDAVHFRVMGFYPDLVRVTFRNLAEVKAAILVLEDYAEELENLVLEDYAEEVSERDAPLE